MSQKTLTQLRHPALPLPPGPQTQLTSALHSPTHLTWRRYSCTLRRLARIQGPQMGYSRAGPASTALLLSTMDTPNEPITWTRRLEVRGGKVWGAAAQQGKQAQSGCHPEHIGGAAAAPAAAVVGGEVVMAVLVVLLAAAIACPCRSSAAASCQTNQQIYKPPTLRACVAGSIWPAQLRGSKAAWSPAGTSSRTSRISWVGECMLTDRVSCVSSLCVYLHCLCKAGRVSNVTLTQRCREKGGTTVMESE